VEDKKKDEQKEKPEIPSHIKTFDPQNPPFEAQHLCVYLSELEEEKEHK